MSQLTKSFTKPAFNGPSARGGSKRGGDEQKKSTPRVKIQGDATDKIVRVLVVSHLATLVIWLSLMLSDIAIDSDVMAGGFLAAVLITVAALLYGQHLRGQAGSEPVQSGQIPATYDQLTQLPNRRNFLHHLDLVIRRSSRVHMKFALLMFDINGFNDINEKYGRKAGDELLRQLAERLTARIRVTDGLARWGADQFAMILENVSTKRDIEKLVAGLLQDLSEPLKVGEKELVVNARVGAAIYPDHSADGTALMSDAYEAMRQARDTPSGNYFLFNPDALSSQEAASLH